ncbi:hypothetical protein HCJ82_06350 [Listeria booriae]|uniref:hypothetical protein n=1 Tax=Listeria booriae TaxID=1552123 RepID=UPI0016259D5B|nr:hypothetical protein [Listeria booriae]MBC2179761.1 hypothetical protein [Listeria booriae]
MHELNLKNIISVVKGKKIIESLRILFVGYNADLISMKEMMKYIEFLVACENVDSEEEAFLVNILWLSDEEVSVSFKNMFLERGYAWHSEIENNDKDILENLFLLSIQKLDYTSSDRIFEEVEDIFYKMGCPDFLRNLFQDISNIYYYDNKYRNLKKDKMREKIQTVEKLIGSINE